MFLVRQGAWRGVGKIPTKWTIACQRLTRTGNGPPFASAQSVGRTTSCSFRMLLHRDLITCASSTIHTFSQTPPIAQPNPSFYQRNPNYILGTTTGILARTLSSSNTPRPPPRNRWAAGAGVVATASMLFGKTKYLLAALKVTKLASLGSMVISIGTYSMFFGFPYAVGVVGLIFVHECGHALVMHHLGHPFSPMVFLPFMGAVIATNKMPRDAYEDALIAAGGPVLGSLGAAGVAIAANVTNSQLLFALADFGFMVNLFNLLPIGSMDGGRWAGALSKYAGVAGTGLGGYIAYTGVVQNPLFYIITLLGAYETFQKFYYPNYMPPNYYKITGTQRAALTAGYFGLIVALLAAMGANQRNKKSPEQLIRESSREVTWDMR